MMAKKMNRFERWMNNKEISQRQQALRVLGSFLGAIAVAGALIVYVDRVQHGYGWNPIRQWTRDNPKNIEKLEEKKQKERREELFDVVSDTYVNFGKVYGTPSVLDVDGDGVELSEVVDAFGSDARLSRIFVDTAMGGGTYVYIRIPTSEAEIERLVQRYEYGQIGE